MNRIKGGTAGRLLTLSTLSHFHDNTKSIWTLDIHIVGNVANGISGMPLKSFTMIPFLTPLTSIDVILQATGRVSGKDF